MRLKEALMSENNVKFRAESLGWRDDDLIATLVELWDGSVKATHHFVSDLEREQLRVVVKEALYQIQTLLVCYKGDTPIGFAGIDDDKLEMLFIGKDYFRLGAGHFLLQKAIKKYGVKRVNVNEDNPGAYEFYKKEGFVKTGRSEKDEQGRDFPLLHLELLEYQEQD